MGGICSTIHKVSYFLGPTEKRWVQRTLLTSSGSENNRWSNRARGIQSVAGVVGQVAGFTRLDSELAVGLVGQGPLVPIRQSRNDRINSEDKVKDDPVVVNEDDTTLALQE